MINIDNSKLVVATSNIGKMQELRKILPESFKILAMSEIGCLEEIPETGLTFEENALQKARFLHEKYGVDCLADDSGLEVIALDGRPGVLSARYAGNKASTAENNLKLLEALADISDRRAKFTTVIALILGGREFLFEGTLPGTISLVPSGEAGFGYDPLFIPEGYSHTFAEMEPDKKNEISHRAIAAGKLSSFLKQVSGT